MPEPEKPTDLRGRLIEAVREIATSWAYRGGLYDDDFADAADELLPLFAELVAERDRLAAEVAELRQIVAAPVSAAGGPEFGQALVGKVRELVDERRHYAIAAKAIGRVRALEEDLSTWLSPDGVDAQTIARLLREALDGTGEAPDA